MIRPSYHNDLVRDLRLASMRRAPRGVYNVSSHSSFPRRQNRPELTSAQILVIARYFMRAVTNVRAIVRALSEHLQK